MMACCFGKLPLQADFIQHNAKGPEIEELYRWFQEGIAAGRQRLDRKWEETFAQAPPTRFLFRPSGGGLLAGVWVAGSDPAGQPHPFLVWVRPEDLALGEEAALAPLVLWNFLRKAEDVAVAGWNGADLGTFLFRVDSLAYSTDLDSARVKYAQYLSRKTVTDIWPALFGTFGDERKYGLVQNLFQLFAPLRRGTEERLPFSIRFPLAPSVIASFWLDLVGRISGRPSLPTLSAWTSTSLSLLYGELDAKQFVAIARPDLAHEHSGCDLARAGLGDPAYMAEARTAVGEILDRPGIPLEDLLERLKERMDRRMEEAPTSVEESAPAPPDEPVAELPAEPEPTPAPKPEGPTSAEVSPEPSPLGQDIHIAPTSPSFRKSARLPVGCYGKLPIFGDFIRDTLGRAEIQLLDQWFQEGIVAAHQAIGRGWNDEYAGAAPSRFLFCSPATNCLIVGVWIASVDRVGRRYPFLIYTPAPFSEYAHEVPGVPVAFSDFFHHAQDLCETGWKEGDLTGFLSQVEALQYHLDRETARRRYGEYLEGTGAGDLWSALFGEADIPARLLLVSNLQNYLLPLRTGSSQVKMGLRFPRATGVEPSLWLDLTMRMSGRTAPPALTAWTESALTILYTDVTPKFYAPVMRPDRKSEHVSDLATDGAENAAYVRRAQERFGGPLSQPALSLEQLLRAVTGR